MGISMLEQPSFLPHQTQVLIGTPCGAGCGSRNRIWMPPIRFRQMRNIWSQARKIGASKNTASVHNGSSLAHDSNATLRPQVMTLPPPPPLRPRGTAEPRDCTVALGSFVSCAVSLAGGGEGGRANEPRRCRAPPHGTAPPTTAAARGRGRPTTVAARCCWRDGADRRCRSRPRPPPPRSSPPAVWDGDADHRCCLRPCPPPPRLLRDAVGAAALTEAATRGRARPHHYCCALLAAWRCRPPLPLAAAPAPTTAAACCCRRGGADHCCCSRPCPPPPRLQRDAVGAAALTDAATRGRARPHHGCSAMRSARRR